MRPPETHPSGLASKPALACHRVDARYGSLYACRQISLTVNAGEVVALLGPNGAGKTSFVGALSGVVRGSGEIRLGDHQLERLPLYERARLGLATVPDNRGLFPALTVLENLKLGARLAPKADRARMIEEAIDHFPFIRKRLGEDAGSLSGGEQQMLAIAKCLCGGPKALVLDEPTQGLAPVVVDELARIILALRDRGLPVLVVEQNLSLVERVVSRFAVIVGGRLVFEGGTAELKDRERIAGAFLGYATEARLRPAPSVH